MSSWFLGGKYKMKRHDYGVHLAPSVLAVCTLVALVVSLHTTNDNKAPF